MMDGLKDLESMAAAGDAAAQYRLAAHYDRLGREDEARRWNEKAAAAGHPGALYTQATELLSASPDEMRVDDAVSALTRAADAGGAPAMRQLGVLMALGLGVKADWQGAAALILKAAQAGYPPAMRELAVISAMSPKEADGDALLREAALKGDWIAAYIGLRRGGVFDREEAAALAQKLKAGGAPLSHRLEPSGEKGAPGENDLASLLRSAQAYAAMVSDDGETILNISPDIVRTENVLTVEECDYLICASAGLLHRSKVVDSSKSAADHAQYRTSEEATFGLLDLDLALIAIYARLAAVAGVPRENCELMGVLRYQPGQEYKSHHDYLPEDAADYSEVKRSGQRARTLLVSLNDDFEGGETIFPRLDLSFAGAPGDALVFHNTDEKGMPYPETLHAGAPVTNGEKWILTLWCRERSFWFWT